MQTKYSVFMKNLNRVILLTFTLLNVGCSVVDNSSLPTQSTQITFCTKLDQKNNTPHLFEVGDLVCTKNIIRTSNNERLEVKFNVTDKNAKNSYDYGHQVLERYRDSKLVERIKLRRESDAYWIKTPFVRIRKQKYFADLDNDGYLEFAIFPFSPGSAIWGTVRIYSLKEKITFWGEGRYQFEGDTFVKLNCQKCSKFNPDACLSCN